MPIKFGLKKISDTENVVYYQKDNVETARITLKLCKEYKQKIIQFWDTNTDFGKVEIFLCNKSRFLHFAPNNKKSLGISRLNQIIINTDYTGNRFSSIILHELSHVYLKNLVSNKILIRIPRWFDEGIAVYITDEYLHSSELLYNYLDRIKISGKVPKLLSINSLVLPGDWSTNSMKYNKVYAHCRSIVEHIIMNHGKEKIIDYLSSLSKSEEINRELFAEVFNTTPIDIENNWLTNNINKNNIPKTTKIIKQNVVRNSSVFPNIFEVFIDLWIIRQISKIIRFIYKKISNFKNRKSC